ncbi:hypothetical protein E1100_20665 [Vibrio owensii]|nr:hypothetical protein E1100_20665 [Vibrio owensii]
MSACENKVMKHLIKQAILVIASIACLSANASTTTGSTVNVSFSVTLINPAFEVSLPTYLDFGDTLTGLRTRIEKPFAISFLSEGTPYDSFHDAPYPVAFFAQNTTGGAQDTEAIGNMQQFFYLGCDDGGTLTHIKTTLVELDTVESPINDLSTCKLFLDTNPESPPGQVMSTLNFTVKYP